MDYFNRFQELSSGFSVGKNVNIENSGLEIRFFPFSSRGSYHPGAVKSGSAVIDDFVMENEMFEYPVFLHAGKKKYTEMILLLHGLNERNWNKYLPWAEFLCRHTGKAVLLFPIAYHVNRSPSNWSNPRFLQKIMDIRRKMNGQDRSLSFANIALSERLSDDPSRFYKSGRQSYDDITRLISEIRTGTHPLFEKNAKVDIFAYSIGAFLSQILLMSDQQGLFDDSRLFMFCGGSIFNAMFGQSRSIMDKSSFDKLVHYYQHEFEKTREAEVNDRPFEVFYSMLASENNKEKRQAFFNSSKDRIGGVALALDTVIPYRGVVEALGHECASSQITLLDLPYDYTHENPFPTCNPVNKNEVNFAFTKIFNRAIEFFSK